MKKKVQHSVLIATLAIYGLSNSANAQTIAGGRIHSLLICDNNTVSGWGANPNGQLGNGGNSSTTVPVQMSLTGVTAVAGGEDFTLVLRNDGTVWACGTNESGQLGNGNNTQSNVPLQVSPLTGIITISGGSKGHSLALKNDGTVWIWGNNSYGQLGNGTCCTDTKAAVQVDGLTGITAIAGGGEYSMSLKNDGTVWGWGMNLYGTLGNGSNTQSNFPVQVSSLTGITAIAAGGSHCLALKNDGTVWAWGWNLHGGLGNGSNTQSNFPVQVGSLTGITAIAAGHGNTSVALKNDGTVWAWGRSHVGQLGNGTNTDSNIPVQVGSLTGITSITGGGYHFLALKNDGMVWAWGFNNAGQLGNGTNTNSNVPVQVTGLCGGTSAIQENLIANSISVYPNPSNNFITIENKNGKLISPYVIINCLGQQIVTGKLTGEKTSIDISDLQEGFYLLQVGEEEKQSFKLIKK